MRTQRHRYVHIRFVIALAGDAKTNGTTAAAKVSAAIPVRAFNGLSVMIFLRRLWKIPALTTSLPCSRRLRNPDQLRRRERYRQNSSLKGVKIGRRSGVHPLGWTDGEGENRLTEPGFRGESPWPSTARIRSSSSARRSCG